MMRKMLITKMISSRTLPMITMVMKLTEALSIKFKERIMIMKRMRMMTTTRTMRMTLTSRIRAAKAWKSMTKNLRCLWRAIRTLPKMNLSRSNMKTMSKKMTNRTYRTSRKRKDISSEGNESP